jgi:hypothetical protein
MCKFFPGDDSFTCSEYDDYDDNNVMGKDASDASVGNVACDVSGGMVFSKLSANNKQHRRPRCPFFPTPFRPNFHLVLWGKFTNVCM